MMFLKMTGGKTAQAAKTRLLDIQRTSSSFDWPYVDLSPVTDSFLCRFKKFEFKKLKHTFTLLSHF